MRIGGNRRLGPSAAGNEQMHGSAAIDRAQLPGRFIGHPGTHAVAKKTERHGHQRLERMMQLFHQRAHGGEGRLVKARSAARQLDGAEIDLGRHEAPQRSVKRGISRSVRKRKKAAANDRALIPKWDPPVERHCVRRTQRAVCHERCRTKGLGARLAVPQRADPQGIESGKGIELPQLAVHGTVLEVLNASAEGCVPTFKAIVVDKSDGGQTVRLTDFDEADLMEGDVTVRVEWSTVNYKDGLAVTGKAPVVRRFPMIAGIDFAGTVESSSHPQWKPGDRVILNGWGVGETHLGGYAEKARVRGDWLVRLPARNSARGAMAIGTAGYTAMLAVMALERHGVTPRQGPVIVTGAAGGLGSVAVALLAKLGFAVIASTGRPTEAAYLRSLGAREIIERKELVGTAKPLGQERWAGGIDTIGSTTLANVLSMTRYGGAVAACGLAGGMDLPATVAPFILRGVSLIGIDSVMCPMETRREAWKRLASDLDAGTLAAMTNEIDLSGVIDAGRRILEGGVRGRVVVKIGQSR